MKQFKINGQIIKVDVQKTKALYEVLVNYNGLHLTGDNIPDLFGAGHNIRITAKIVGFNEDPRLILLEPVSIKMR